MTIIQDLGDYRGNHLFVKREDLIPFSFGGNKARKAQLFFRVIDQGNYDCVVTYGSGSSNHCRVVANECCRRGIPCCIISPEEASERSFNSQMMELFGAEIITVPVSEVHDMIEARKHRNRSLCSVLSGNKGIRGSGGHSLRLCFLCLRYRDNPCRIGLRADFEWR